MKKTFVSIFVLWLSFANAQYYSKYFAGAVDISKPIVNQEFINTFAKRGIKIIYRYRLVEKLLIYYQLFDWE